jgi:hypothetical protein
MTTTYSRVILMILMFLWAASFRKLDIPQTDLPSANTYCVASATVVANDNGMLRGAGDIENLWAYNDNGVPWSEGNLAEEDFNN